MRLMAADAGEGLPEKRVGSHRRALRGGIPLIASRKSTNPAPLWHAPVIAKEGGGELGAVVMT